MMADETAGQVQETAWTKLVARVMKDAGFDQAKAEAYLNTNLSEAKIKVLKAGGATPAARGIEREIITNLSSE